MDATQPLMVPRVQEQKRQQHQGQGQYPVAYQGQGQWGGVRFLAALGLAAPMPAHP